MEKPNLKNKRYEITFTQYVHYLGYDTENVTPSAWQVYHKKFDHDYEAYCWMRFCMWMDGLN